MFLRLPVGCSTTELEGTCSETGHIPGHIYIFYNHYATKIHFNCNTIIIRMMTQLEGNIDGLSLLRVRVGYQGYFNTIYTNYPIGNFMGKHLSHD